MRRRPVTLPRTTAPSRREFGLRARRGERQLGAYRRGTSTASHPAPKLRSQYSVVVADATERGNSPCTEPSGTSANTETTVACRYGPGTGWAHPSGVYKHNVCTDDRTAIGSRSLTDRARDGVADRRRRRRRRGRGRRHCCGRRGRRGRGGRSRRGQDGIERDVVSQVEVEPSRLLTCRAVVPPLRPELPRYRGRTAPHRSRQANGDRELAVERRSALPSMKLSLPTGYTPTKTPEVIGAPSPVTLPRTTAPLLREFG